MIRYTLYRIVQLIPVLLMVSVFVFVMIYALPGDVIDALAGEAEAEDPAVRAALEKELGLDKPVYVRYFVWLGKIVLHGDFGKSIATGRSIGVEVFNRIPATVYLAIVSVILSLLIAIPMGTIAAVNRRTWADYVVTTASVTGISFPQFWFAILCVLFFALYLGWLPPSEYESPFENLGESIKHLILPASALGVRLAAITTRLTRSAMLDEISKDYVDTAPLPWPARAARHLQIHAAKRAHPHRHRRGAAIRQPARRHRGDRGHLRLAGYRLDPVRGHRQPRLSYGAGIGLNSGHGVCAGESGG